MTVTNIWAFVALLVLAFAGGIALANLLAVWLLNLISKAMKGL